MLSTHFIYPIQEEYCPHIGGILTESSDHERGEECLQQALLLRHKLLQWEGECGVHEVRLFQTIFLRE